MVQVIYGYQFLEKMLWSSNNYVKEVNTSQRALTSKDGYRIPRAFKMAVLKSFS